MGKQQEIWWLMVQTAEKGFFDISSNTLTLEGVGDTTLYFSDRPARLAGTMPTDKFIAGWDDQFGDDPPNAVLVDYSNTNSSNVAVSETALTITDIHQTGSTVNMKVKILEGTVPEAFVKCSLFIDHLNSDGPCVTCPQPFGCN